MCIQHHFDTNTFSSKKTGNCPSRINREVACTTFAKLNATHFFLPFFFLGTCPESSKRASPGNDRPVLYHPKKEHHMSHANQNGTGVLEEPVNKKYLRWHFGLFFQQITIQNVWRHHLGKKRGLRKDTSPNLSWWLPRLWGNLYLDNLL